MGGAGAGLGTSLAYWVLLAIAVLILCKHPKVASFQLWKPQPYDFKGMKEILRLGLPISGIVFAEVIIFSLVGLLMAKFPSLTIASHQSAMNFSTLMYAFPVSISSTMAIIVSYELGAGRPEVVRQYCRFGPADSLWLCHYHPGLSLYIPLPTSRAIWQGSSLYPTNSYFHDL